MNTNDIIEAWCNPVLLIVMVAFLAAVYIWRQQHHLCNYPEGPFSFPLLGNLPQIVWSGSMSNFLNGCQKVYGSVFTIKIGGQRRVVVRGYDNIYQLVVKNADYTSNRNIELMSKSNKHSGIIWAPFPHWKTLRSFALKVMREEGMGKASLEPKIHHEISMFCKHFIEPRLGKPYDLSNDMANVTLNIISEMIFGGRSDYDDPDFNRFVNALAVNLKTVFIRRLVEHLPIIRYITRVRTVGDGINFTTKTIKKQINEHKNKLNPGDSKDIIDEFLVHQMNLNEAGSKDQCFTDGNLIAMASQLYMAGTETTSTALKWALLFTAYHPNVMKKVQEEIITEIGADKEVANADRGHMPYTDAVLLETLRNASVVQGAISHLLEADVRIDGKVIPAGSDLLLSIRSALYDDKVFENPEEFNPDRFLAGDMALKKKKLIPFSLGRRVCLGEGLARMELFLIYVTIMQRYNIKLAEDSSFKIRHSNQGGINTPHPYRLIFSHK